MENLKEKELSSENRYTISREKKIEMEVQFFFKKLVFIINKK